VKPSFQLSRSVARTHEFGCVELAACGHFPMIEAQALRAFIK
jgi:hypothetical protein